MFNIGECPDMSNALLVGIAASLDNIRTYYVSGLFFALEN